MLALFFCTLGLAIFTLALDLTLPGGLLRRLPPMLAGLQARITHPHPLGFVETGFWLLFLIPLIDHALAPSDGRAAGLLWFVLIGPHEMGHFICAPFGTFIMFLGGSIWQVLFFMLLGVYGVVRRRQWRGALLMCAVVGHSFINMSVYIRDAQERDLPLLFGLGEDHHDWWNILSTLGLLSYDNFIADMAYWLGIFIALGVIAAGIYVGWMFPPGTPRRYSGSDTPFSTPKNDFD